MQTLFEALRADHETQRTLLAILVDTEGESEGRQELFPKLERELEAHATAEEQTLYAALMSADGGQEKARHSVAEHKQIDDLVAELRDRPMDDPAWLPRMKELAHLVEHHLEEEEHEVFQLAGRLLDEATKRELAAEFGPSKARAIEA